MKRFLLKLSAAVLAFSGYAKPIMLDFTRPSCAAGTAATAQDAAQVTLNFAETGEIVINLAGHASSLGSSQTAFGHDASKRYFATFVKMDGSLAVEVRDISSRRLLRGAIAADGTVSSEAIDLSSSHRGGCIEIEAPEIADLRVESAPTGPLAAPSSFLDGHITAPAPVTVDIMLVFDQSAAAWVENSSKYSSITNFAVAQVAKMNSVLANTGLEDAFWFRLVDVMTIETTYTAVDNQILGIMKAGAESGDGPYGAIKAHREESGADLVSLMIDTGSATGTTGIGYITHGTTYSTWLAYRAWCYSCCAIRSVDLEYTLSHEVGHNMGLAHSPTLPRWTKPGTFDYSNGFNFWGKDDGRAYHTIMAYDYDRDYYGYTEIPYYSSPDYTYQGTVIGTVLSNDCTRALRETASAIAAWRTQTIPLPSDIVFSPSGNEAAVIRLSAPGGYEIRYTLDGSTPTRTSLLYETPIILADGSATVNAVAVVDDATLGAVASKNYTAAVSLSDYALLLSAASSWKSAPWLAPDGTAIDRSRWYLNDIPAAILASEADIEVDTAISLDTLTIASEGRANIIASSKLSAASLETAGAATLSGTNFSFDRYRLHPGSTLVLSPGQSETLTFTNTLALADSSTTFAISNGTVTVTAPGSSAGIFSDAALHIQSGGTLEIGSDGWKTGLGTSSPLVLDAGGTLKISATESIHRPIVLNGGTIDIYCQGSGGRALDLNATSIDVTDNSTIQSTNPYGYIAIRQSSVPIHVAQDKTLTINSRFIDSSGLATTGCGIVKSGGGTLTLAREAAYSGETIISNGTLKIEYTASAASTAGWTVSSGAVLEIASGATLQTPTLDLANGAILALPAASTAALAISGNVSLAGVAIRLDGAQELSYGTEYPLLTTAGSLSRITKIDASLMPALDDGLAWQFIDSNGTLAARVATVAEASSPVPFSSNIDGLILEIPADAETSSSGVTISDTPLFVDSIASKAVAATLDVTIPPANSAEAAIASWSLNGNIVRLVRMPNGLLDCYYATSSQTTDNSIAPFYLTPGRHLISIVNHSKNDSTGGTYIYVDGTLAYRSASLKWSNNNLTALAIGATCHEAPLHPYPGLAVHGIALLDLNSTSPLTGMTSSGCSPKYTYFNGSYPTVFALPPSGGFMMDSTTLVANLDTSANAISVSVIASFPEDAQGTIFSIYTAPAGVNSYSTAQAEYSGDGTFFLRYNGNTNTNPFTRINDADSSVQSPHLYTITFSSENGVCFYQDGVEILHQDEKFLDSNLLARYRVLFGCGPWSDANPNPMPGLKIYASHIALATDSRAASESAVLDSFKELWTSPLPVVDVLVAFDNGGRDYVSSKGTSLEAFAQEQIDKMNATLATNRLDTAYTYRLAGTATVDGTYSDINTTVGKIAEGAGPFASLRAERELCGADTVTLLVKTSGSYLGHSSPLTSSANVSAAFDDAFSVCNIAAVDTGDQHTMIHENAHNMGAGHSRSQASNPGPSAFSYGSGYYFTDAAGVKRHTIMAYDSDGSTWHAPSWYFSTSSGEFGITLGDAENDNARVLRETCPYVARWREETKPFDSTITAAIAGETDELLSGRVFSTSASIELSSTSGKTIVYTLDGSTPTAESPVYSSPIEISATTTITAAEVGALGLSKPRTIKLFRIDGLPANAVWRTSLKYPWSSDGSSIRSANHTNYSYYATSPLEATVTGPSRLVFSRKSYFFPESLDSGKFSHFDVLIDDSPAIAEPEYNTAWGTLSIEIPSGTHRVAFVFSQRLAMNNPSDYKDGSPLADDAVWLENISISASSTLEIPAGETLALEDVPAGTTAITGSGTLVCNGTLPSTSYGFTSQAWQGTVLFKNLLANASTKDFQPELFGNANSTIEFENCSISYLASNNASFTGRTRLSGQNAFTTLDGYSSNYNVLGSLEGSGAMAFSTRQMQAYVFTAATNFTGSITIDAAWNDSQQAMQGRRIVLGSVSNYDQIPSQSATISILSGASASIASRWYAYHGFNIAGTLAVKAKTSLAASESAALGIKFENSSTLSFDSSAAALSLEGSATGQTVISTSTPVDGSALVLWNEPPAVAFTLENSLSADWCLAKEEDALRIYQMPSATADNVFTVPATGVRFVPDIDVVEWYGGYMEDVDLQEFLEEPGANGYARYISYALGIDPDADKTVPLEFEISGGEIKLTPAPDRRKIKGLVFETSIYAADTLDSEFQLIKTSRSDTITLPIDGNSTRRFYKAVLTAEP